MVAITIQEGFTIHKQKGQAQNIITGYQVAPRYVRSIGPSWFVSAVQRLHFRKLVKSEVEW